MRQLRNYIDGDWRESERRFRDINPVDGSLVAEVHEADAALVDAAVRSARRAVDGTWGAMPVAERSALLHRVADEIDRRFETFVDAECADTGRPRSLAASLDIPRGAANFRAFADMAKIAPLESYRTDLAIGGHALNYVVRRPIGVVGIISPWNLPLLLLTWKVAPALACGNAVVAKPSEEAPSTATLLAEVIDHVGLPRGVFNLVHGFGRGSAGEAISSHAGVDAITFTGSSQTGKTIMRAAADHVKPVSFELGGKNAALVFADCDIDRALDGLMQAVFTNAGQVCLCTERVYVQRPIFDRFVGALVERVKALPYDDRRAAASQTIGPMISAAHREKVRGYYALARSEGATILTGGGVPRFGDARDGGFWVEPTVMTGLPDSARSVREEIFGPVCHIAPFDDESEVIARANDTEYGLAASVWTQDLDRAHRVAPALRVGTCWVNSWFVRDLRAPFGGAGLSGIGREGGMHSINFYSELSNVSIRVGGEARR